MVKSMTAYARANERLPWGAIEIELRSVNHRFLEMNVRMPEDIRALEMAVRERIKETLDRGKIDLVVCVEIQSEKNDQISFNSELASQIANTLHKIDKLIYNAAPVNAVDILKWPGVQVSPEVDLDTIQTALLVQLDNALEALLKGKEREGQALKQMITQRSTEMRKVIEQVRNTMPEILQAQRQRLEERLQILKAEMDTDRLEQEMVYIAQKADVAEEVDRLDTHLDEIARVMESDGAIGRRLDFLMQELNREANTLGSKSIANATTQASVEMKVLIEQMREQIQNIE